MFAYPFFMCWIYCCLKALMLSVDLMSVGREFYSNADVEATVYPPYVALLLLGHRKRNVTIT